MKFSKKAQVEVQFNWIFVILAGAVFLGFFFMLISNQTASNETSISASLSKQFKTRVESTANKANIIDEISLPSKFKTEFVCDTARNIHYYSLNDFKSSDIKYEIIFAPKLMNDRNIYLWTRQWELPNEDGFPIANFLYMTNKMNGYVFKEDDSDDFDKLYYNFPQNISVHLIDEDYTSPNYDSYTFIGIDNFPSDSVTGKVNKYVKITKDPTVENIFVKGEVCFKKSPSQTEECTEYLGAASLYGAIIAEDKQYYECVMDKAFKKLRLILMFQYYSVKNFAERDETDAYCKNLLSNAQDWLAQLAGPSNLEPAGPEGKLEKSFSEIVVSSTPNEELDDIYNLLRKLEDRNMVLLSRLTCMNIY